jgi:signal transduction histidine kinase
MSDNPGSILQTPPKVTALSQVNLLIVTDNPNNIQAIASSLQTADIEFTYDLLPSDKPDGILKDTPIRGRREASALVQAAAIKVDLARQQKYSAILYDYAVSNHLDPVDSLIEKIQWWCHLYSHLPFILITEALGDEPAVKLVQSGVDAYILRHNLSQLPDILPKTLFDFVSKQTIITQQEDLIRQQQATIQQLEAEKQDWLGQQKVKQENISHLNHELRSPIASIVGFARMLKEEYYGPLNTKQSQYASGILSSGEHLLALVKNYLDLVKIDANKQTLEMERLAIGEICQAAVFIVAEKAQQKELKLNLDLDCQLDFCIADSVRLKQILINLLSNAIKFTEQGSITLEVKLKQDWLNFAVIDTGTGISATNLTKLFKPFPQITNHHESTGLGLTLSRKLAQLHGGDITVTSELGQGSCFTLVIPQDQSN